MAALGISKTSILKLTGREHEVERVEIDEPVIPADLICVADTPRDGVEHRHDDATGKHQDPGKEKHVGDEDEHH